MRGLLDGNPRDILPSECLLPFPGFDDNRIVGNFLKVAADSVRARRPDSVPDVPAASVVTSFQLCVQRFGVATSFEPHRAERKDENKRHRPTYGWTFTAKCNEPWCG